ncbi:MAG: NAD(+) synthase [Clostridia bacterium]|nr:NAD(+) synthase [Clostridia bacterium]
MKNGFVKVGTATPRLSVADCKKNLSEILNIQKEAQLAGVHLMVYPELCLTGCTCADLFFTGVLQSAAVKALDDFLLATRESSVISIIGLPLVVNDKLYNSAVICQNGQILGVIPKGTMPNYNEHSEGRYFASYTETVTEISLCGQTVPFGAWQIFTSDSLPSFRFAVEIGTEAYSPLPASSQLCTAGALLIANPTAMAQTVGAEDFQRLMVTSQSARCVCAYASAGCGDGESTTDLVFAGYSLVAENGKLLAEKPPFFEGTDWIATEIDLERLSAERRRLTDYPHQPEKKCHTVSFHTDLQETPLTRFVDPHPFIPSDPASCARRCDSILMIQAKALAQRMTRAYAKAAVIGISGGLDSCLAMLVAANAMDLLKRPHTDIIGVTMPCFGTTKRTKSNAELLCTELGAQLRCVNISASVRQHFADIGHEESNRNVVYENAQARERTQVIMDIANMEGGLVVGTGDLSELALGWATYNGDHMSMYGVNGGVPKTLIRHIVATCADHAETNGKPRLAEVLRDILNTPVSPELLPADQNGDITQKTEDLVGPYELHDFYLYNMLRWNDTPDKLFRLAKIAFAGRYSDEILLMWLKNFVRRFFTQQFKRSCLPDGPKVGSVGFSPRGDWKMPSDASSKLWLDVIETL